MSSTEITYRWRFAIAKIIDIFSTMIRISMMKEDTEYNPV